MNIIQSRKIVFDISKSYLVSIHSLGSRELGTSSVAHSHCEFITKRLEAALGTPKGRILGWQDRTQVDYGLIEVT